MYPVLILRSEFICLVILVYLFFMSRTYGIDKESKPFRRILNFAIIHIVFDGITVVTVNHLDSIPNYVNWICHVIFYLSAIFYSIEIANYVYTIVYPKNAKKLYAAGHIGTLIYILSLSFLKIDYVADVGTYSSSGLAAYVGYGFAFLVFIVALINIFTHQNLMPDSVRYALVPMMLVLIFTEFCQVIWRSVLFTGGAITIVTIGLFFTLENPVEVFKKKAMFDALTGVQSRSSYEEDIKKLDECFKDNLSNDYTFVFCDINDLRNVNNQYGHYEGDNYITLVASSIKECMKDCKAIYRIGGDEFLIYYEKVNEEIVDKYLKDLRSVLSKASKNLEYEANIAAGYATSSKNYNSLYDVVKSADYAMYQNKAKVKGGDQDESTNSKINYVGLTDSIFEAVCASNDHFYPFITNMNTNVTRISPEWKKYFGLDSEFYNDFLGMWKNYIHKDYYDNYMDDVVATINGHKKFHHSEYLARRQDGEYVMVTCHGSIYLDNSTGITYFTGYIINHGLDENVDPLTGLKNFDEITTTVSKRLDDGLPFALLKLKLINFARVNMLYGYGVGDELIVNIADYLKKQVLNIGEVFCQSSTNFTILFNSFDKKTVEQIYQKIADTLLAGINTSAGIIPVRVAGGVYLNKGEMVYLDSIRSGLVYAVEESNHNQRNALVFYDDKNDHQ